MRTRKQMLVTCCIILIGLLHGMQRATAQTQQLKTDVEFNAPALQGWSIVGTECRNTAEGPSRCSVRLRQENGVKSSWTIDDVVFVAWAKGGESFALETASSRVYLGKAKGNDVPNVLPGQYTTPALSTNGKTVIAEKLGYGDTEEDRLSNSPGLALIDVQTGEERLIGPAGAFAPFFIKNSTIGYGHVDENGIAALYALDVRSGTSTRMTNLNGRQGTLDPMPEEPPAYDDQTDSLVFVGTENGSKGVFRISLSKLVLTRETVTESEVPHLVFTPESKNAMSERIPDQATTVTKEMNSSSAAAATATGGAVLFRLPFDPSYYQGIYNFMDHNGKDWGCGTNTYAGHSGTDFKLNSGTPVLAAAPGVPYYTVDGCPDNGSWGSKCGGGFGNQVRLLHSDGRVSIYGHMKKGTVIAPSSTATVECGNAIGLSGNSGKSTDPHLHFEIWQTKTIGTRIDPYLGSCNPTSTTGEWISQSNAYPSGLVGSSCQGTPSVGDFSVYAPVFTQTITQGSAATFTVQVQSLNGFNGVVRLQALNLPSGYDVSRTRMSPEYVTPPINGSVYATLTIGTNTSTATGRFVITIQGSSGSLVHSTQVELIINAVNSTSPPTISSYSLSTNPIAGQLFNVNVSGTNFVVGGTRAFFCISNSTTCYEHPQAGVNVSNSTSLTLSNVNLGSGSWQFYLLTSAGQSARSAPFTVQSAPSPPAISSYSLSTNPIAGQSFNVYVSGTNFVIGGTRAFFCIYNSTTCYEHPSAGVNVSSSTSLTLSNVNLGSGSWQFYLLTSRGQSARSAPFTVQSAPSPPAISSYSLSTTPIGGQPFNVGVSGTRFVVGGTRAFFCIYNSATCYEHPSAGVNVSSSTSLTLSNVNLGSGSWQFYLLTSAGQSARSAPFTVR